MCVHEGSKLHVGESAPVPESLEKLLIFVYNVYCVIVTNGICQSAVSINMRHRDASPVQSASDAHGRSRPMR